MFHVDYMFRAGKSYDDLLDLIRSNPRYVFFIHAECRRDKRTKKARLKGWAKIHHKKHEGEVKLIKERGRCFTEIDDMSGGHQLLGAWLAWLASNAADLVYGVDVRFE